MDAKERLDRRIEELSRRLEALRAVRLAMDDSALVDDLADVFASNGEQHGRPPLAVVKAPPPTGVYEQIVRFFDTNGNRWATIKDLEAVGLVASSIRQVLYRTRTAEFDRRSYTGGGKPSRFRRKVGDVARHITMDADGNIVKEESPEQEAES